jgi:hypothetical protein
VTAPLPGQPLYTVQPTLAVGYWSDDPSAPLDLDSLRILVNGDDWTERFSKGPASATYRVSTADALVAGSLAIAASVSDTAGVSASVSQAYEVFPTLRALVPDTGEAGDSIAVGALGLDFEPSRNRMLLKPDGIAAAFEAVDRVSGQGTFIVPPGTRSGPAYLEVNGKRSDEAQPFTVPAVVPNCGEIGNLVAMADGSWAVAYWSYASSPEQVDPRCPAAERTTVWPNVRWRVVRVLPNGDVVPIRTSARDAIGQWGVRMVVDKAREKIAVITRNDQLPVHVYYDGRVTYLSGWVYNADFDADGNLYVAFYSGGFGIWRVSKESLAVGGDAALEPVIEDLPLTFGSFREQAFAVSCDGFALVAIDTQLEAYPWVQPRLFRIDLASGTIVGDLLLGAGESMENLALSCDKSEIWGMRWLNIQEDSSAAIWRAEVTATGFGPPTNVVTLPSVQWPIGVSIGAGGNLYLHTGTTAVLAKRNAVPLCPGSPDALPICARPAKIGILPSATRWKPQRDAARNIEVNFTGPKDLNPAPDTRLEIKDPSGNVLANPTLAFEVVDGTSSPAKYKFTWSGPWTGADGKPLPAGDYKLNIIGQPASGSPINSQPADYVVSLVEVKGIRLEEATGLMLQNNPGPGGGKRIFAEAAQPGGTVSFKVKVIVTIFPPVLNAPADQPVRVFFRSFDVDDPSAATAPVDDESHPTDNCLQATAGPPQNCPVADEGFLYDPIADPAAGSPVNGRAGIALKASGDLAAAGLRVAMLQGANYRVAASTSSTWLDGLETIQGAMAGELRHTSGESLIDPATGQVRQVSEMLTVWRTLFLQMAKMPAPPVAQSAWDHQATATCPTPPCIHGNRLEDTNGIPHPDHNATDVWAGADLDVTPTTPRTDKHVVRNSTLTSLEALTTLTPFDPAFNYALWDDEVASSSIWAQPNASLARSILQDAFIEVQTVPGITPSLFRRNLPDDDVADLPTSRASSADHWTAPVVLAFEGDDQGKDGDPANLTEEFRFGLTNGRPTRGTEARQPRVAIYAETIRDYSGTPLGPPAPTRRVSRDAILINTTAHEILHLFGLIHDGDRTQGGIMCAQLYVDANEPNRTKVTPNQLTQLRQATELKIRRDFRNCP